MQVQPMQEEETTTVRPSQLGTGSVDTGVSAR